MKQKIKGTIKFIVNEEKRTVVCKLVAHGKDFFGIAQCLDTDTFDVEKGKVLAQMRATIKQRSFDLKLTRQFIDILSYHQRTTKDFYGCVSPHYMRSIQTAKEEEKAPLPAVHLRRLSRR